MRRSKFLLILSLALVLAFFATGVCFASSEFPDQPVSSNLSKYYNYPKEGGIYCGTYNGSDAYLVPHGNDQNPFDCYFFTYSNGSNVYVVGVTSDAVSSNASFYSYTSDSSPQLSANMNLTDSETGLIYQATNYLNGVSISNLYIPVFSSLAEGLSAVRSAIDNVPVGESFDFTLTPGYALVIDGECEVSSRSFRLSGSSNLSNFQSRNGSVQWFGSSGNIRDGFSPDKNSNSFITWEPVNPNSSGAASIYQYNATDVISVSSGASFVITNPLNYGMIYYSTGARLVIQNVAMTGTIYIEYSGDRPLIRRVALSSHEDVANGYVTFYNTFEPSVFNENVTFTAGSGGSTMIDPSDAPIGGADAGSPPVDDDQSFLGVIERLISQIKGLFSSAVQGISNLVTEGSSFMRSIAQIFTWLPEPLVALLISGFTVLLVVGVLKVLWK